jgi:hypothetical protein
MVNKVLPRINCYTLRHPMLCELRAAGQKRVRARSDYRSFSVGSLASGIINKIYAAFKLSMTVL